jgi:radical SAM protein with 4Fe4S-binding SPASM domain
VSGVREIHDLPLWGKMKASRTPASFELELTARCNNHCRHCYIDLPAGDERARAAELSIDEVLALGREAVGLGALWCLLTGGEPLLRDDLAEVYLGLKRLGLLVSVFTNACLVTPAHVELFRRYPPRDLEVTVYGATRDTYEAVTRRSGSFAAFSRGLDLLLDAGLPVRLKAMALRSNLHELDEIARFCRERTKDYYRFDPFLHLRLDGDEARNADIRAERLTPEEVVAVEGADPQRIDALHRGCADGTLVWPETAEVCRYGLDKLFHCGAGESSFTIGYDGTFRLCSALCHPETVFALRADPGRRDSLRPGALRDAWDEWVPRVRALRGTDPGYLEKCRTCNIVNLCAWCPAHAALESGRLDAWVERFCAVAHARAAALCETAGDGSSR